MINHYHLTLTERLLTGFMTPVATTPVLPGNWCYVMQHSHNFHCVSMMVRSWLALSI
jgi:hypothetical protein